MCPPEWPALRCNQENILTISAEDRVQLLSLAQAGIRTQVLLEKPPLPAPSSGLLSQKLGCFVTLTNAGRLRGCIGTFMPDLPLGQLVLEMARAAAQDSRFMHNPITPPELERLSIEVSLLSPLVQTNQPELLEVGKDGIYIVQGNRSGCFLPEVATDQGWDAPEFLSQCCAGKAGLPPDAWRDSNTKVFLFTSEKISR